MTTVTTNGEIPPSDNRKILKEHAEAIKSNWWSAVIVLILAMTIGFVGFIAGISLSERINKLEMRLWEHQQLTGILQPQVKDHQQWMSTAITIAHHLGKETAIDWMLLSNKKESLSSLPKEELITLLRGLSQLHDDKRPSIPASKAADEPIKHQKQ